MPEQDAGDTGPDTRDTPPSSVDSAKGGFDDLLDGDGLGGGLLGGNDFTDLLPELQSNRPDEPVDDLAGGQPVDDPQYDDTDPYPYGIADL